MANPMLSGETIRLDGGNPHVAESGEKLQRGKGRGRLFFALDRTLWPQLWSLETSNRLNFVAAYLVLLAGTGSDHQLTNGRPRPSKSMWGSVNHAASVPSRS